MKVQSVLLLLGVLVALATSKPAEDAGTAQLLLRSCDRNADNALNAAEFAGCLMQQSRQQRVPASRMGISRTELLQSFMDSADLNGDLRADEAELQEWSERWFLSGLFGGGGGDDDDDDDDDGLTFAEILDQIILVLQYIGEENYGGAASELYVLITGYELSVSSQASVNLAITALNEENYGQAIGYIYAVIRELAGGDDAGGIFTVSASTVTNIASLLEAVIENDSANINIYIYGSLAGLIVDFTFLSQESASSVAAIIQAVIEGNNEQFYMSLTQVISTIEGISTETATALSALIQTVISGGESDEIGAAILAVMTALFEDENVVEIARIFVAVIEAVIAGDSEEAEEQLTLLLEAIAILFQGNRVISKEVYAQLEVIIQYVNDDDSSNAIIVIQDLLDGNNGGDSLSAVVTSELELILTALEDDDYAGALAQLIVIMAGARSRSLSSSSTAALLVAIQSVSSGSSSSAIDSLELLLEEATSSRFRDEINVILQYLDEDNFAGAITALAISVIGSGNSIEASVAEALYVALRLSISGNYDGAASEIEAILEDEEDLDGDIKLALLYVAQLLREENSQGALTIINVVIEEAFGVDQCYCA